MKPYKDLAINTKLTLLVLLAGSVAIILACVAFVNNDVRMIRSSTIEQMSTLAEVLGSNSTAALHFHDPDSAKELLATLATHPVVEQACIYDAAGSVFAVYEHTPGALAPPTSSPPTGHRFAGGYLDVVRTIDYRGQPIGTIYLHASMSKLDEQILHSINIVAGAMIVSLAASILLSSRMQRLISVPILKLAEAAEQISIERDYSIRVVKTANDELGTLYDQFNAMLNEIQQGEAALERAHNDLEFKIEQRTAQLSRANRELSREIGERTRTQQELDSAQEQLMVSARRAGMAEVATGVLHNVGNVLNSVNVSATLAVDRLRQSKVNDLVRAVALMEAHADDLGGFITQHPKGKNLPRFLRLLATHLADERSDILTELDSLTTRINHLKTVISTQQSYAGVSGILETVDVATMLDDAMKLNSASFNRHRIMVVTEHEDIPKVKLDKQRVVQILVNLISNARDALADMPPGRDRVLTLRTLRRGEDRLQIEISDNGVGIAQDDLTRIFSHGFTTKSTGHGFGLHSCAIAAGELGGSLVADSDGIDQGATFILELPYEPVEVPA